jgi:hypothetical protein
MGAVSADGGTASADCNPQKCDATGEVTCVRSSTFMRIRSAAPAMPPAEASVLHSAEILGNVQLHGLP